MRVIAGTARAVALLGPKGQSTRPTAARMKEDLFNILSPRVPGARFLDLYCGSGAIGIEALSRGAAGAVFADASRDAIRITRANLLKTRLAHNATVLHMPASQAVEALRRAGATFSIIFLDPPYRSKEDAQILPLLGAVLAADGIIVAECAAPPPGIPGLTAFRIKRYSGKCFVFYQTGAPA